jgi:hypothetical protein
VGVARKGRGDKMDEVRTYEQFQGFGGGGGGGGMGFRDFACFNKALFAKQSWRLWNNPASLVARLMKAKYYLETSILEAKIGQRPSFVWRSILSSCDLLREGLVWRVGNGSNIRIWKDKLLPNTGNPRIISPPLLLNPDAMVSEL